MAREQDLRRGEAWYVMDERDTRCLLELLPEACVGGI
jgi:hypothetical protein